MPNAMSKDQSIILLTNQISWYLSGHTELKLRVTFPYFQLLQIANVNGGVY